MQPRLFNFNFFERWTRKIFVMCSAARASGEAFFQYFTAKFTISRRRRKTARLITHRWVNNQWSPQVKKKVETFQLHWRRSPADSKSITLAQIISAKSAWTFELHWTKAWSRKSELNFWSLNWIHVLGCWLSWKYFSMVDTIDIFEYSRLYIISYSPEN